MEKQNPDQPKELTPKQRLGFGMLFFVTGAYILFLGLGLLPGEQEPLEAPAWVANVAGAMFMWVGIIIFTGSKSKYNDFMAGILMFMMGIIGAYVSFFAEAERMSGGLGIFSANLNMILARVAFGFGAIVCFAMAGYAMKTQWKKIRSKD